MKKVIRIGDPTSHGGTVLSGSPYRVLYKKNVARLGDIVSCPQNGHTNCVIIEGDPSWLVDGKPAALEGHLTSCGAVLFSSLKEVDRSYEGSGAASTAITKTNAAPAAFTTNNGNKNWIKFTLDEVGSCAGLECTAHFDDGTEMQGTFNNDNQISFADVSGKHVSRIVFPTTADEENPSIVELFLNKIN
ncbi:MAG: hypothetical protein RL571_1650 [Pseudomonadota bacterium]|jgi:uncharacterized Zn-binding protein involved in type VI secretion